MWKPIRMPIKCVIDITQSSKTTWFFIFIAWFKPIKPVHNGDTQGIDQQIFNWRSISHKITHPQSELYLYKAWGAQTATEQLLSYLILKMMHMYCR